MVPLTRPLRRPRCSEAVPSFDPNLGSHAPDLPPRNWSALIADGKTLGEVAKVLEISDYTYLRWRSQYGELKADDANYQQPTGSDHYGLACHDEVAGSVAGRGRSCRSNQEPSLTIRSVVGTQPVTNG